MLAISPLRSTSRSPPSRRIDARSPPRALRRRAMEPSLPTPQVVAAFPDEGREDGQAEQQPVQEAGGEAQRPLEIDEQHHAQVSGLVPGLVLVGIVEDQRPPFFPVPAFWSDAEP